MSKLEDPTAFDIDYDPRKEIMSGVTTHGHIHFSVPFISEVHYNLWNGGCEEGLVLPKSIKHLISLYQWEKYTVNHDLDSSLTVKMYDSLDGPADEQIIALARWVNVCREMGPVLVHCQAGLNRSGMVVATAMMLAGLTAEEAIGRLRDKRSKACLCNPVFEKWLLDLDVEKYRNVYSHV